MKKNYSKHFYQPIRTKIASETIQRELRKLLRSVPENLWPKLDHDVESWFEGKQSELSPVHDFWNGFEGITQGFKLKNILPYLTAKNIEWRKGEIPLEQIFFTSNLSIISFLAKVPFKAKLLIDFITQPGNQLKVQEIISDSAKQSCSSIRRDNYRIIVLKNKDGFYLLDGHRRVFRSIIKGKQDIKAFIGEYSYGKSPEDWWVSTGFLRNLKRLVEYNPEDKQLAKAVDYISEKIIQKHSNAKYIYPLRVKKHRSVK